ncbi:Phosphomannomutase 2 [Sarcoptes scabiei]|uniref:Phosphomannomutase n=1 Tax=Sarcoptes scabiei TaxID=52283 RepID=A0A834VI50_SARSC|nr:Phosphomannomutase 2 [Sarcoptes scabiei]UXI15165.1 Inositol oxygenase [Sarcoptes scabiei]
MKSTKIVLFDIDGTLTEPRQSITTEMDRLLLELHEKIDIGLVSGSDLPKLVEQMNCNNFPNVTNSFEDPTENLINRFDYIFAENGLVAFNQGKLIHKKSIVSELGENKLQEIINFVLEYLSKISLPKKRGNFIEFRNGMINVSPIGRSCSQEERMEFFEFDRVHGIRRRLVEALQMKFNQHTDENPIRMHFAIGGQISIDCYPQGWDKSYCLQFLQDRYEEIYFFGDRTQLGGNDYEIAIDPRTKDYTVSDPGQTKSLLKELFFS